MHNLIIREQSQNTNSPVDFKINYDTQEITSSKGKYRLRAKLWQVFLVLLEKQNQLISREELIELAWCGNNFTGPQGVNHSICHLRRIVRKLNLPLMIVTLPKQGYLMQRMNTEFQPSNVYSIALSAQSC